MRSTTSHRHDCDRHDTPSRRGVPMYYGWSHDQSQMQMMDLPEYLEEFRRGYERALEDLQGQLAGLGQAYLPGAYAPGMAPRTAERRAPYEHGRHHHHEHHHGCGHGDDCRCECCIVDADYVVYARCYERRVVPIEIENDTRKARDDVTLEVSDVRTAGGRVLPWRVVARPESPLTLEPCSTTQIDLLVDIRCDDRDDSDDDAETPPPRKATGAQKATRTEEAEGAARGKVELVDVDECEVGYVTIRVGGCIVRPIVVAIAVVPRDCDAYHARCSCSCCC